VELEALAVVSDVKATGAGIEADWPTGTWRLEEAGGTDTWRKTEPRRTKAYDVTVYDKSELRPCTVNNFC